MSAANAAATASSEQDPQATTAPLAQGPVAGATTGTPQGTPAGRSAAAEQPAAAQAASTTGQPSSAAHALDATSAPASGEQAPSASVQAGETTAQVSTATAPGASASSSQTSAATSTGTSASAQTAGASAAGSGAGLAPAAAMGGAFAQGAGRDGQAEGEARREDPNLVPAKPVTGSSHPSLATAGGAVSGADPVSNVLAPGEVAAAAPPSAPATAGGSGVDLQQTIDAVRATIALAARQGVSQARIALQPQELGDIRIHLTQTADGLLARLTADTAAGAQALAGGRAELHQSLSSLGISLLRLDIGSGQYQAGGREGRFGANPDGSNASSAPQTASEDQEGLEVAGEPDGAPLPSALQSGGLVDVLA